MTVATQVSRRSFGKAALAGVGALGATCLATSAAHAAASDLVSVSLSQRAADTQKLLSLINTYRAQNGLGALSHSPTIATVMEGEARRQFIAGAVSHSNVFLNHPQVQGYTFAREIIALSWQGRLEDLLAFWKSSPAHNAALLAPEANVCGIGFAYGNGGVLPWRVLGNVALYRYRAGDGPNDYNSAVTAQASTARELPNIVGGILSKYNADGGAGFYGDPTQNQQQGADGGYYQAFNKNGIVRTIYWHPQASGHIYEHGAIGRLWRAKGSESGLGYPLANEHGGLAGGGYQQRFRKGNRTYKVLWHPSTGAHSVYENGAIGIFWARRGFENGLGYPLMSEEGGLIGGGVHQRFRKGNSTYKVLWHPVHGTNVVYENGAIGIEWARHGHQNGLGYPLTAEYLSGVEIHQRFSNGYTVAWHSFTGAVRVFRG